MNFLVTSFDNAQQVLLPFYPDQAGALHFLTGRTVKMFGIINESEASQETILVDEGSLLRKGADSGVAMLDHRLRSLDAAVGELRINCDNFSMQNKSRYLISY